MTEPRKSIGREKAIELANSKFWEPMTHRQRAEFQMNMLEMCMPFDVFHEAVEKAIGRPVFTHEFGLNYDGILAELNGEKGPPTFEEIVNLIPADKRVIVALVGSETKG